MIRRIRHLAGRFFEVLGADPLTPAEQIEVSGLLRPAEHPAFWGQAVADQRHGLAASRRAGAERPEREDLMRAALLHDIGKRAVPLGIPGRVVAALLEITRLPAPGRMGRYLRHGALGAEELAAGGAEPIVVAFAAGHHGPAPEGVDHDDWAILNRADGE